MLNIKLYWGLSLEKHIDYKIKIHQYLILEQFFHREQIYNIDFIDTVYLCGTFSSKKELEFF